MFAACEKRVNTGYSLPQILVCGTEDTGAVCTQQATQLNATQRNARAVVLEGDENWVVGGEERRVFDGENHVAKRDLCAHGLPVRYDRLLVLALPVPAVDLDAPARNTRDTSHSASAQLHCSSHATGFVISDPFLVFLLRTLFAREIIQDGK